MIFGSQENLTGILLTQRMMDSPQPPLAMVDFWSLAYQASMIDRTFSSEVGAPVRVKKTRQNKDDSTPAITFEIISLGMSVPENPIRHIQEAGIRVASRPPG